MFGPRKRPTSYHSAPNAPAEPPAARGGCTGATAAATRGGSGGRTRGRRCGRRACTTRASSARVAAGSSTYRRRYVKVRWSNSPFVERQPLRLALNEVDPRRELGRGRERASGAREHVAALVEADDGAAVARNEATRDEAGAGRDVQNAIVRAGVDRRDHLAPPARVLPEAERRREQVVAAVESREQRQRAALALRGNAFGGQFRSSLPENGTGGFPLRECLERQNFVKEERRWPPRRRPSSRATAR